MVEPIRIGSIENVGNFSGTLLPSRRVTIASKVSGQLIELSVNIGDAIRRGQVLARLDDSEIREEVNQVRAEVMVARANLAEAESSLELARRDLNRITSLRSQDFVTQSEREVVEARVAEREARLSVAEASLTLREASLRRAEIRLGYTAIEASWEDDDEERFVSQRFLDAGSLVSVNQPILEVVSLQNLIGQFFVSETDFYQLRPGMPVEVSVAGPRTQVVQGTIARLSPQFSAESRRALVEVSIPNNNRALNPGVFARFQMVLSRLDDGILVPRDAVVRREEREGVFLVDPEDRRVRFTPVNRLFTQGDRVAVTGLPQTGLVVVLGQDRLVNGSPVTWGANPLEETPAAPRGERRQRPAS
jgi:RND family efflux transporter MFP subunit